MCCSPCLTIRVTQRLGLYPASGTIVAVACHPPGCSATGGFSAHTRGILHRENSGSYNVSFLLSKFQRESWCVSPDIVTRCFCVSNGGRLNWFCCLGHSPGCSEPNLGPRGLRAPAVLSALCFLIPVLPLVPVFPPSVFMLLWSFAPTGLPGALPGSTHQLQVWLLSPGLTHRKSSIERRLPIWT